MLKKILLMVILFLCVSCDQQPEDFCYSDQKKHKIRNKTCCISNVKKIYTDDTTYLKQKFYVEIKIDEIKVGDFYPLIVNNMIIQQHEYKDIKINYTVDISDIYNFQWSDSLSQYKIIEKVLDSLEIH
ncbi:MAG: hypothetical protein FWC41_13480 [Firmicutes bacterium]|nr:hypothetical protein [Bacillota bacterium]